MGPGTPILLVEDNKIDIANVRRAFAKCAVKKPLQVARTGEEALAQLRGTGGSQSPRPGLILVDINMPVMNGLEFLTEVKRDPALCQIPIVALTTSSEGGDRQRAFALGIAGYFIKPMSFSDFVEMIRLITLYWSLSEQP